MARPSPAAPVPLSRSPPARPACLRKSCGSRSGAIPRPSSQTEIATCTPSHAASTRMGEVSGAWRAALANRLFSTCTMRSRSASTGGRSGGRSMRTPWRAPPLRKVVRARSTRAGTSEGSASTDSVPASIRPTSSRSLTSPSMWSACSSMIRKNWRASAGFTTREARSAVAAEPLIEVSGARSSWLTSPRNSARSRSSSSSGARSCRVAQAPVKVAHGVVQPFLDLSLDVALDAVGVVRGELRHEVVGVRHRDNPVAQAELAPERFLRGIVLGRRRGCLPCGRTAGPTRRRCAS